MKRTLEVGILLAIIRRWIRLRDSFHRPTDNWRKRRRNWFRLSAQLLQAQANQRRTQLDVDRYVPLAKQQAITQQDLDNDAKQSRRASTGRCIKSAGRNRKGADSGGRGRRGGGESGGRGGQRQSGIHASHVSDCRNRR